jgi:hypothetical protein
VTVDLPEAAVSSPELDLEAAVAARQWSSWSCGRSSRDSRHRSRSWSVSSAGMLPTPPGRRLVMGWASLPLPRGRGAPAPVGRASSPAPRARTWPGSRTLTRSLSTRPSGAEGAARCWCWRRWSGWRPGRCWTCPRSACEPSSIGPSGADATVGR